jgi:deoxyribodipyrimidine photolyase-related protein
MSEAAVIYPHQLFADSPAVAAAAASDAPIYLIEEPLILTHNPIHRQKLMFHKLSLDAYERRLRNAGHQVTRLTIETHPTTEAVFAQLRDYGVTRMHIIDTTDDYLEQAIAASGIERVWHDSPLFLLSRDEAIKRFRSSKHHLAHFYKSIRRDWKLLLTDDGDPCGGQWSFDEQNREKLPKDLPLPNDPHHYGNRETRAAKTWAANVTAEQYGTTGCWLPYTHDGAAEWLADFLVERFATFGPYEDAITTRNVRLFHSALSPLLNVGLLTPLQVLNDVLAYADTHDVPINSLEGFIRQLTGWREFMRASYETHGRAMRAQNFWGHTRSLPQSFWDGTTGIAPVDHVISTTLTYGYSHHIERLMVMGNFMLLCQLHPDAVYEWFMGMYLDAYDWVMVPNVYGMSQFADGGSFATKPYISGANYLKKMSDYESGEWEKTWTALYWNFIATHYDFFTSNHRLAMMPRLLDRMNEESRTAHFDQATTYLRNHL